MNPRLFNAARMGNLGTLYELLAEDPLVLEKVYLGSSVSETPLHTAALLGHIDFAKEIIRRKLEFAKELNKDGFTPIHMASANGHINIVRELLSHGGFSDQCVIKDGEGRTPLHYAVIRGRTDIMDELLTASSDSIREVTALSETVLHLAVKNNQFEALKVLVNERHIDGELLNAKDCRGNTVLHLAISRKQHLTGNLLVLEALIAEDTLILEKVSLGSISDTPLHIAALVGQLDFAKEVIRRKPEFAKELNKDGFSPIHMASANGHLEIVKELLMSQFGYSLCLIKDNNEGRTALHYAVIKGRTDVMSELLSASSDSVQEVTTRGETVLHLAVKNNQFEALKVLVEKNVGIEEILNAKDRDGNTVLHLAVSKRQHRTIELLLGGETVNKVDVNAKNAINLTAMDMYDISLQTSCDLNDIEMGDILRRAGALRSRDINDIVPRVPSAQLVTQPSIHNAAIQPANQTNNPASSTTEQTIIVRAGKFFNNISKEMYREIEESSNEAQSALMVVAVLIATVTYQGGINPPGGVWQDHQDQSNLINNSTLTAGSTKHLAGKAVMEYEKLCFILFMVFNTVGFFMSLIIISLLTSRFPLRSWLRLAVVSMATAFGCGFCFISSFNGSCTKILLLCLFIGAVIGWKYWWIEKWVMFTRQNRQRNAHLENLRPSFIQRISTIIVSRSRTTPINTV